MSITRKNKKRAFSLIEISVVLLIIAIFVSGALTVSVSVVNSQKAKITKERMAEIYRAIGRFVATNYRLPCPAPLTLSKNSAGYAIELGAPGVCSGGGIYFSNLVPAIAYGAVPAATLGLPDEYAEDGFGSKFAYLVRINYTKAEYPATASTNGFSFVADINDPKVISFSSAASTTSNAFILISFGANKYGAFNSDSTTQIPSTGASTYEITNALFNMVGSTADFGMLSAPYNGVVTIVSNDDTNNSFDDIVFYKTRSNIISDYKMNFLMPCIDGVNYPTTFYDNIVFRNTSCPVPNSSITPTRQCGPFGLWIDQVTCP